MRTTDAPDYGLAPMENSLPLTEFRKVLLFWTTFDCAAVLLLN